VRRARHLAHDVEQSRLPVITGALLAEHAVVPVVAADVQVELEGVARNGSQHGATPGALVHRERLAVAAPANFQVVVAAHEVVVAGIERIQQPHATVGVGPEHHQVAILLRPHVHLGAVAPLVIVLVQPDPNGRVARLCGEPECEYYVEHHRIPLLP
jgi:hypothetical protein